MSEHRLPRVLVVDDEAPVRGLLCDLLAAWGCQAVEAANVAQPLTLFEEGDYDLVLTDYVMPGGTGLELIQNVRGRMTLLTLAILIPSSL